MVYNLAIATNGKESDMSKKFYIESKAGVIFGLYEGDTPDDAFSAMTADAGDGYDVDGRCACGTPDDWTILEVVDVDREQGATLYTLENGGVLVESGPHLDYYVDMSAARAALGGEEQCVRVE